MRILAVDDEYVAITKMQNILSDYGTCDIARDGKEALNMFYKAYLQSNPYSLITIDLDMPNMNGLELLRIITKDEDLMFIQKAKKIIITAEGSPGNVIAAMASHSDAFVVKPVKKEFMEQKLKDLGLTKI
jgi:two-component system chemotaxis response regulator CheY